MFPLHPRFHLSLLLSHAKTIKSSSSSSSYNPISIHHPLLSSLQNSSSPSTIQILHAKLFISGLAHHPFVSSKLIQTLIFLNSPNSPISLKTLISPNPPNPPISPNSLISPISLKSLISPNSPNSLNSLNSPNSLNSLNPLNYAFAILLSTPHNRIFSYNLVIKAISNPNSSFFLFKRLLQEDPCELIPNQYTFAFVFNSFGLDHDKDYKFEMRLMNQVMGQAVLRGFDLNLFICNVLIRVFGSWGMMGEAERVFKMCSFRDLFSWNCLIGGFVGLGDLKKAVKVFEEMPERDVVSWSTLISGFVQEGLFMEAMELFHEMQRSGVAPNEFTLTSILTASANLVALEQGRWIHSYIKRAKISWNEKLLSSLIDMYAKCGEIGSALKTFEEGFPKRTVHPWNAMLGGFAIHGMASEAVDLFERMSSEGISPNKITFISLLSACSHGISPAKANSYFESMTVVFGIRPEIEHYGCMVDLFGRAGLLNKAEEFISLMPMPPDFIIWSSLLNACRIHRDVERAERVGRIIKELNPKQAGCQVLLANIYSSSGKWAGARKVRNEVEVFRPSKVPGWSSIELDGIFHQFLVGDKSHPQTKQIYLFLDELNIKLRKAGYEPELGEVLVDVDEEDKETALSMHSEKLAIAFGLINTAPGTTIRVVKNLRVCIDCHQATKLISKLYDREIVVRDRVRFHYFKDGKCSCKDFW